ncbi:DUF2909 family protein [Vibrio europaeus]|uniref:DUF2909 domain-containing protein n=1 Tax=Vibrio europaeus TaxID=300876 RepID=A0AAE7AZZ0_9VIBR|nr:DUF2909 family protein [Vibrio europaeus]MDC5818545.1 DUF2909 domain-containing protein [Vibrio europaeus]MDC5857012.1 DUF2909 domain-containing protein [Vibrio europaeus]MDC5871432.1 DUF2909 domain-containing protein [Vibrio europaeus]NOH22011.1 DUF2909 domain-containing protein [Vibrio europaeus]QJY38566.1 DUF2909 domain-containing protein [Vibrio europaeus]
MVFIFKLVLVLLLLFILFNLGRAMFEMVKGPESEDDSDQDSLPDDKPMSFYLGRRVFLSALAVVLMVAALLSGLIEPNIRPY